jgi:hypothetical protein
MLLAAPTALLRTALPSVTHRSTLELSIADVASNVAGTCMAGYLTSAAAGPAVAAIAATVKGLEYGSRSWSELRTPIGFALFFSLLAGYLATNTVTMGATALSLAPTLIQLPLLAFMLAVVAAFGPMIALLSGTFLAPSVPFRDIQDAQEYQQMQDSYRSDSWQPPKLWTGQREADESSTRTRD